MMREEQVFFEVHSEKLFGTLTYGITDQKPTVLLLHGGLQASDQQIYLAKFLAKNDISSFRFDFSGHGQSSGKLSQSSLKKKFEEALAAIQYLDQSAPITLIGSSMGGYIGIKLLKNVPHIINLILFGPAAYTPKAYDVRFDSGFTEIIRQTESFRDSDTFDILRDFTGHLLILTGEHDEVIPPGIITLYKKAAQNTKKKEIKVIEGAPHKLHEWFINYPLEWKKIKPLVMAFVKGVF